MNKRRLKKLIIQIIILSTCYCLLSTLIGCEAFVRKFTRKPKEHKLQEEPVLVPQDYSLSDLSTEERYRQYFLFWKSWQDELITAMNPQTSYKKKKECVQEAINNLEEIRALLLEEKQKELDVYLERLRHLSSAIIQDIYGTRLIINKSRAESLKRSILRDFSYSNVKGYLR